MRHRRRQARQRPPVSLLFDMDRGYRARASSRELRKNAPNDSIQMARLGFRCRTRVERDGSSRCSFPIPALAHELRRTIDRVIIRYHTNCSPEGQCTIPRETHGPLAGHRMVRGREEECAAARSLELQAERGQCEEAVCAENSSSASRRFSRFPLRPATFAPKRLATRNKGSRWLNRLARHVTRPWLTGSLPERASANASTLQPPPE